MGIIKNYHDKKWALQFLDVLYNSIDIDIYPICSPPHLFCSDDSSILYLSPH
jgi:hypothetical protein